MGNWFLPFTAFLCALGAWGLARAQETAPEAELPKGVIAVPLKVFANRLFIPITLNGEATCEGLLDTGSEVTLINKARVKLTKPRLGATQQLEGAFVGGLGAQRVTLDSLAIGAYTGKEVPAAQVEQRKGQKLELIDMLLGMDFLGRFRFTLDFARERFLLWTVRAELGKAPAGIERLRLAVQRPYASDGNRPRVYGTVNEKHRVSFLVDTGADGPLFVAFKKPEEYGFQLAEALTGLARINDGGVSRELPMRNATYARLDFEGMSFADVPGKVLDASAVTGALAKQDLAAFYNILGTPFLKTCSAVHFDLAERAVYLERAKPSGAGEGKK